MGDTYTEGCLGRRGQYQSSIIRRGYTNWMLLFIFYSFLAAARAWLFIGFLFAFGGLIGSLWIFIQEFLVPGKHITLI